MYGHEVYTSNGKLLLNPYEESLMYWGRKYITPQSLEIWTSVFNIPRSENACLFFKGDGGDTYLHTGFSNQTNIQVQVRKVTTNAPAPAGGWVYVFVRPTSIPLEGYGSAFYGEGGRLQYHTTRPPLQVRDILSGLSIEAGEVRNVPQGSAVLVKKFGTSRSLENPNSPDSIYRSTSYHAISYNSGTEVGIGRAVEGFVRGGSPNTWTNFNSGSIVSVPTIDTNFYNQINSRGGY